MATEAGQESTTAKWGTRSVIHQRGGRGPSPRSAGRAASVGHRGHRAGPPRGSERRPGWPGCEASGSPQGQGSGWAGGRGGVCRQPRLPPRPGCRAPCHHVQFSQLFSVLLETRECTSQIARGIWIRGKRMVQLRKEAPLSLERLTQAGRLGWLLRRVEGWAGRR